VAEVVEDGAAVHEHPLAIGEVRVRSVPLGDARLEPADGAVAEVADQAADEGRGSSGRTNSKTSISSRRQSRGGSWSSKVREPDCSRMVPSGPWRTRAMGSSPRKEYRPQRSPPWTDSRRKAWEGVGSLRKALTGVSVSPGSSRQTGTRFPRAASRSKLARLIRVSASAGTLPH
jgi:hypothetical protein